MRMQPKRPMSAGSKPPISTKSPGKTRGPALDGKPASIRPGMGSTSGGGRGTGAPKPPKPPREMSGPRGPRGPRGSRDMEGVKGPRGMGDGPDRVGPTRSAPPSMPKSSRGVGGPAMGGAPARDMEGPRGPRGMGGSPSKMGAGMGGGAGGSRPPTMSKPAMSKPAMGKPPVAGPAPSGGAPAPAPKPPGMKKGGRVKKMAMGGKCRGMGAAKMGGKYKE